MKSADISKDDLLKFINNIHIPRNVINKVGTDYFNASISQFQNSKASFLVDAGSINKRQILVFIITTCNNLSTPFLFDLVQNFDGTLEAYRSEINNVINKAKQNKIDITGITTDNLPVQVRAISENCENSIQNIQNILYFRCMSHLLALAFEDWISIQDKLTIFESSIKNIFSNIKQKKFSKNLPKRIPSFINTRWYSHFKGLYSILEQRKKYISFFQKTTKEMIKGLREITDDMLYLLSKGFRKVYPLLVPFYKLTIALQYNEISCVDCIIIIEHYIEEMENIIYKYQIPESGKRFINCIKRRLLLNKNTQIY